MANGTQIGRAGFRLLAELRRESSGAWLRENAEAFEARVRTPFANTLERAAAGVRAEGENLAGGRQTLFRIWRDRRFRPNAPPVHAHVEGVLARPGERVGARGAVSVRLDTDGGTLRAGSFLLDARGREALRAAIVASEPRVHDLLRALKRAGAPVTATSTLERGPRRFHAWLDTPLGFLLRMQDPMATARIPKRAFSDGSAADVIVGFARATADWRAFTAAALEGVPVRGAMRRQPATARPAGPPKPTRRRARAGSGRIPGGRSSARAR